MSNLNTQTVRTIATFGFNQSAKTISVVRGMIVRFLERLRAISQSVMNAIDARITNIGKRGIKASVAGVWQVPVVREGLSGLLMLFSAMRSAEQRLLPDGYQLCECYSHVGKPSSADHLG